MAPFSIRNHQHPPSKTDDRLFDTFISTRELNIKTQQESLTMATHYVDLPHPHSIQSGTIKVFEVGHKGQVV